MRDGNVSYYGEQLVQVLLVNEDLNLIKEQSGFGDASTSTYLAIAEGTTQDLAENINVQIEENNAQEATLFLRDETGPRIVDFTLALDTLNLLVTFSETVNSSSVIPSRITIQNDRISPTASYPLQSTFVIPAVRDIVNIQLNNDD